MHLKKFLLFGLIAAVLPAFAEEAADRKTATSLKYVTHELDTRQNKFNAEQNKAMEYTNSAGDVQKRAVTSDLDNGGTESLPMVGGVNTKLATKQDDIAAVNDHTAVTYTGQPGGIGRKGIYQTSESYANQSDNLIDAKTFNAALKNGLDSEFKCRDDNLDPVSNLCWLYTIHNVTTDNTLLPAGYTLLEYIASTATGHQRIDTTILPRDGRSIEITLQGTGDRGVPFSFDQDWCGAGIIDYAGHNGFNYGVCASATTAVSAVENQKNTFLYSLAGTPGNWIGTLQFNDEIKTSHSSRQMSNLTIFAGRAWFDSNSYWVGKIYSVIVRDGSTITNNFIPALNSDGVAGLYDIVGRRFYPNSDTNGEPFVAGPENSSANLYIPQNQ